MEVNMKVHEYINGGGERSWQLSIRLIQADPKNTEEENVVLWSESKPDEEV